MIVAVLTFACLAAILIVTCLVPAACGRLVDAMERSRLARTRAELLAWLDANALGPDAVEPDYGRKP